MLAMPRRTINLYQGAFRDILSAVFSGEFILGESITEFENAFADFVGSKEAIVVSSGSAALRLILESFELPPESEVILPAYTAEEVPNVVEHLGLKPIFVDINNNK